MNKQINEAKVQEAINASMERENQAILEVLNILDECPVPVTQSEVVRRICKQGSFVAVRKLGPLFLVLVAEHNNHNIPLESYAWFS